MKKEAKGSRLNPVENRCLAVIEKTHTFLWNSLLTEGTWEFYMAYKGQTLLTRGMSFKQQDRFISKEAEKLGPSILLYIDRAYQFMKRLGEFSMWATLDEKYFKKWFLRDPDRIHALGQELELFLGTYAGHAIQIEIDLQNKRKPAFSVRGLEIDTDSLRAHWDSFTEQLQSAVEGKGS